MKEGCALDRTPGATPILYGRLAGWWPLISDPADYADEAAFCWATLRDACVRPPAEVLELGSGGGNNASHLKLRCRMTLVDRSPGMLAVSRRLNPECEHVLGDMRNVRLGREFDAVFVHDAIGYMATPADLARAIRTAHVHCRPSGAILLVPDAVRETFRASTEHGGLDGSGRAVRYLQWTWDPDPDDESYLVDLVFALRGGGGAMAIESDRHHMGLFARGTWLRLITEAGLDAGVLRDAWGRDVFVAVRHGP
ncbi:MAG: class I SAM-dependent methyltransferase [Chthonomonadales bacterium]|nr:class I SAM-dependent methyltransferase [Chthonomonadales bacterium]